MIRARGQALVPGLALLFASVAALWLVAGAGRAAGDKHRLIGAADAAAYSAAAWRARVLNFHAYSNRAIVANEVAVAQAVTLSSWAGYFERLADTLATYSRVYPPLAAVMERVHDVAELVNDATAYAAEAEVSLRAAPLAGQTALLARSQELMQLTADGFALSMLAAEVVQAGDRRFFAHVLAGDDWSRFTRRYDSHDDRRRLADVVRASLDGFTGGARRSDIPIAPSGCPLGGSVDRMFNWIRKRGATVLADDLDRWEAHDTVSQHQWRPRRGVLGLGGCRKSELLALGWGAVEASAEARGSIDAQVHDTPRNPEARDDAASEMRAFSGYGGIVAVRELDYAALADDRDPAVRVAVLARADRDALVAGHAALGTEGAGHGRLRLRERPARDRYWALAAAEVRFRPPRDAAAGAPAGEWASLFSPYWQARLVAPSAVERAEADRHAR